MVKHDSLLTRRLYCLEVLAEILTLSGSLDSSIRQIEQLID